MPNVARALVVSVAESWFPPRPPSSYQAVETTLTKDDLNTDSANLNLKRGEVMREAEELGSKAATWIQTSFPRWDVQAEPLYGSPASELLAKSDDWGPDLIVTGSRGRSAIGRLILGSISHKVITEAPCSVRIGRQSNKRDPAVRILVGVDGSHSAAEAARAAACREWPAGSEIRFVAVYDAVTPTM